MDEKTDKRVVIVHHHIFKNAGTSFNYALKQAFGKNFLEYDLPNSQVVTREALAKHIENNPSVVAISGHHIALPPIETESFRTISSAIIRDPLSRVRSIYKFERKQNAQTEGAIMAKKLNFKDFVSWRLEKHPSVFCDYQTLYCSRRYLHRNQRKVSASKYSLDAEDLELAVKHLQKCFAVGTVERYQFFLMMAQYEASKYFPEIYLENSHLNATTIKKTINKKENLVESLERELGKDIVEELKERNRLDERLYKSANLVLDQWLTTDTNNKSRYFERFGRKLSPSKEWQKAKVSFQNSILITPKWFKPYHDLAEAFEKNGDDKKALSYYEKSINLNSNFAWSYFRMGELYFKNGFTEKAFEYYQISINKHERRKSFFMFIAISRCLSRLKRFSEAALNIEEAEKVSDGSIDHKIQLIAAYTDCKLAEQKDTLSKEVLTVIEKEEYNRRLSGLYKKSPTMKL